ncbi:hypothetical protein A3E15_02855 [Candidatus Woesebacteria bacterium RIFCSPHIGHO2_12_FULL_42_9]|uniref:Glycosyl transferase family 1 domain-containing protein n=2 Tax=Candidatus Woeseibacteriota TaxID=1752722 RepID=A0A1F8ARM4_9BACT|nr:MAG: hypothetical protein A2112_00210 [Candidatus Woesebacteria bacterium GWA1_42_12]OGM54260.1 MAG: hypothetical protein A3E15_02855 [Candidatus Woesebacteria bacterium RIFCSPHIGHO2_12_FULL_42_9]
MKIGIDGVLLTLPFQSGTRHYAEELIFNLAKIDNKNEYVIFASKYVPIPKQNNFTLKKIPNIFPIFKRQLFLAKAVKDEYVDVFHYLAPYGSMLLNHPRIITTVHDLRLDIIFPTYYQSIKYYTNRFYCEITRKSTFTKTLAFITVSKSINNELLSSAWLFNKNATIDVIPQAADIRFKKIPYSRMNGGKFFLAMGDFSPRKNIGRVIEAFVLLPKEMKQSYRLKIVASTSSAKSYFSKIIKQTNSTGSIEVLEDVSLSKLVSLYNSASVFVYPSLYEGFGIPILEAMACGCPVITSNYGAVKEVAGNAAYFVNPKSPTQISKAMEKIITDKRLYRKLRASGLKRVKQFSWEKTARKTLEIYNRVYSLEV